MRALGTSAIVGVSARKRTTGGEQMRKDVEWHFLEVRGENDWT